MKLLIVRVSNGTFVGQTSHGVIVQNHESVQVLYQPAIVDFITLPVQSVLSQPAFKTVLNLVPWPTGEMAITWPPVLYATIDTDCDLGRAIHPLMEMYQKFLSDYYPESIFNS